MKYRCTCHPQSAFRWREPGYQALIQWSDLQQSAVSSQKSTEVINDKRAVGKDLSTVHGLSNKVPMRVLDPRHFHVFTKARSNG
jgi:hypothetical protein